MKKLLFLTLLICIAFSWSCKKYDDDDYWFTLRTPLNRVKGNKRLVEATYNGENLLPIYRNMFGPHYFEFTDESLNKGKRYYIYMRDSLTNKKICEGWWHFNFSGENYKRIVTFFNNDEYIKNSCLGEYSANQIYLADGGRITKLTKNQLWTISDESILPNGTPIILSFKFESFEK